MMKVRVAYIISHPIQHFCPMFKEWAKMKEIDLKVFFASAAGAKKYFDPNFGKEVFWEGLYLDEFRHVFLNDNNTTSSSAIDAPNVVNALNEFSPDVLVILGYNQKYQRRALKWAEVNRRRILMFSDSELRQPRAFYKRALKKLVLPYWLKKVDAFLTTGNANEEYYQHYGVPARKFFRSAYPIDSELYENAYEHRSEYRKAIREKLQLEHDDIVCMVVGKFVAWKNQEHLIEALKFVNNKKVKVMLIGSGEQEPFLKKKATAFGDRVIFAGFVPSHELTAYYAAADIYVHPSEKEPHSVAISEATYMGLPVIVSENSGSYGTADDVRIGVNGFVYPFGEIEKLAAYISKLTNESLRRSFGEASNVYATQAQRTAKGYGVKAALLALSIIDE
jgi:glycosyltransferase involved in cell wall biosynthesis